MFSANHGCAGLTTSRPAFSAAFFTDGEHLVPLVRDILQPPGTIILSPGKVWSEPGDRGMSRASFPFVVGTAPRTLLRRLSRRRDIGVVPQRPMGKDLG